MVEDSRRPARSSIALNHLVDVRAPSSIHVQRSVDVAKDVAQLLDALTPTQVGKRLQSVLDVCLNDNRQAWELDGDGSYTQRQPGERGERATHRMLLRDSWGGSRESGAFTFEVSALRRDAKGPGRPPSSTAEFRAFTQ